MRLISLKFWVRRATSAALVTDGNADGGASQQPGRVERGQRGGAGFPFDPRGYAARQGHAVQGHIRVFVRAQCMASATIARPGFVDFVISHAHLRRHPGLSCAPRESRPRPPPSGSRRLLRRRKAIGKFPSGFQKNAPNFGVDGRVAVESAWILLPEVSHLVSRLHAVLKLLLEQVEFLGGKGIVHCRCPFLLPRRRNIVVAHSGLVVLQPFKFRMPPRTSSLFSGA